MIFATLAWNIEFYMTKYIIGEMFSSGGATLYKNPSDQLVDCTSGFTKFLLLQKIYFYFFNKHFVKLHNLAI